MWRNFSSVKRFPKERQRPRLVCSISSPLPCLSILRITCHMQHERRQTAPTSGSQFSPASAGGTFLQPKASRSESSVITAWARSTLVR